MNVDDIVLSQEGALQLLIELAAYFEIKLVYPRKPWFEYHQ